MNFWPIRQTLSGFFSAVGMAAKLRRRCARHKGRGRGLQRVRVRRLPLLLLLVACGCAGEAGRPRAAMFGPAEMRLNPTFTRVTDAGRVRADLELRDAAGDLTKGAGRVTFALHDYDADGPADILGDPRGGPASYELADAAAQGRHWQSALRTYRFRLPFGELPPGERFVLLATYDEPGGGRLADRVLLAGRPAETPAASP